MLKAMIKIALESLVILFILAVVINGQTQDNVYRIQYTKSHKIIFKPLRMDQFVTSKATAAEENKTGKLWEVLY